MAWLTSLLQKPATEKPDHLPAGDDVASAGAASAPRGATAGPPMALLAPDIAGISSFRLRILPTADAAAAELESMPPEMRRGTHAFWALHDEPAPSANGHSEALVLIRANHTSDVVYAVSFVDLESAWSFARFEAKRGLDVSHLVILWAAFATVREELDGVTILPPEPPQTKASLATAQPPTTAETSVQEYERPAAATTAPTDAEADSLRRFEAEEAERIAREAQAELRAARAAADAARAREEAALRAEAEAELRAEEQRREKVAQRADEQRRAEERRRAEAAARASVRAELAAGIEVAMTAALSATDMVESPDASGPALEALAENQAAVIEPEAEVATGTVFAHGQVAEAPEETAEAPERLREEKKARESQAGETKAHRPEDFDIAYEVARLLENRRFAKREEPFKGFESPPGRF